MNSINIIGRIKSPPFLEHIGERKTPCLRFLMVHVRQIRDRHRHIDIPVILWGAKAEAALPTLAEGGRVSVTGAIDRDHFSIVPGERNNPARLCISADEVTALDPHPAAAQAAADPSCP